MSIYSDINLRMHLLIEQTYNILKVNVMGMTQRLKYLFAGYWHFMKLFTDVLMCNFLVFWCPNDAQTPCWEDSPDLSKTRYIIYFPPVWGIKSVVYSVYLGHVPVVLQNPDRLKPERIIAIRLLIPHCALMTKQHLPIKSRPATQKILT